MSRNRSVRTGIRVAVALLGCLGASAVAFAQGATYAVVNELPQPIGGFAALTRGSDGLLYGVFAGTGTPGGGSIFRVPADTASDPVTFTIVHEFTAAEGLNPADTLTLAADGRLYGVTSAGGANGFGTLFRLETDNSIFVLHAFTSAEVGGTSGPKSGVVQAADGGFYGVLPAGGTIGLGAIYRVGPAGVFGVAKHFTGGLDGMLPNVRLTLGPDGSLYGVTPASLDAAARNGTVFRYTPSPAAFLVLQRFSSAVLTSPRGPLTAASDGNLYGTTSDFVSGGVATGAATVYKVGPATPFTSLHGLTVAEGRQLQSALIEGADGNLYGTAAAGGDAGTGTVFRVSSTGAFVRVYSLPTSLTSASLLQRQSDGALLGVLTHSGTNALFRIATDSSFSLGRKVVPGMKPSNATGRLVEFNGQLLGMAASGGVYGYGALFRSEPTGAVTTIHSFSFGDGALPNSLVVGSDGNLYGSTVNGGASACGTIFRMTAANVLTTVHHFPCGLGGAQPGGLLRASDGKVYGVTGVTATAPFALVFKIDPAAGISVLQSFPQGDSVSYAMTEGVDGRLYVTQPSAGTGGFGRVLALDLTGAVSLIYEFTGGADGRSPLGVTRGPDDALYGLTFIGADGVNGGAYRLAADGTLTPLHQFTENGGAHPTLPLTRALDGYLYGATAGTPATIFRISPAGIFEEMHQFLPGEIAIGGLLPTANGVLYGTGARTGTSFTYAMTVPMATTLTAAAAGGVYGGTVSMSATLAAPGGAIAGQTVSFALNGTPVGSAVTNAAGVATLAAVSLSGITAGTYPSGVDASFAPVGAFLGSTAVPAQLTITPATTSTSLVALPDNVDALQPFSLTATVAVLAPTPGPAPGVVEFREGATVLGTGLLNGATATLIVNGLASGPHAITAVYLGDGNFASSTSAPASVTVRSFAAATLTIAAASGPTPVGSTPTIAAVVLKLTGGVATGRVQFFDTGVGLLGTANLVNGVATIAPSGLAAGLHVIIARYVGNGTLSPTTSMPILLTVYSGTAPAPTALQLSPLPNPSVLGQMVTFTATVTGAGTPTGTVYFFGDGMLLGSAAVSSGLNTVAITTSALSRGAHVVGALFVADAGYGSSNALPTLLFVQ